MVYSIKRSMCLRSIILSTATHIFKYYALAIVEHIRPYCILGTPGSPTLVHELQPSSSTERRMPRAHGYCCSTKYNICLYIIQSSRNIKAWKYRCTSNELGWYMAWANCNSLLGSHSRSLCTQLPPFIYPTNSLLFANTWWTMWSTHAPCWRKMPYQTPYIEPAVLVPSQYFLFKPATHLRITTKIYPNQSCVIHEVLSHLSNAWKHSIG